MIENHDSQQWLDYVKDTWSIFPIYTFYEVNCTKLPWNTDDRIFVFSNVSTTRIEINHAKLTKFFDVYTVNPVNLSCGAIGYIFKVRNIPNVKVRYTTHGVSACTSVMTEHETARLERNLIYDKSEISMYSYGNDAEVVTDLTKVMGVVV